ncbi:DUF7855 family protein [Halomarina ordinaria]|uniref:Uncharacterized protein n=1 Tax=Halomarina ordinaria TaxID=3033939 RepID=A0ABD5UA48_9EURY|nr:hypothetical protein [Halomarina sp. PSRA2]
MLLVIAHSRAARGSLRNVHRAHEECVVQRFGRVALFEPTELAAFHALRLREKHPGSVELSWVAPFNEFDAVPERVRRAARAYEARERRSLPYAAFAAGSDHPDPEALAGRDL